MSESTGSTADGAAGAQVAPGDGLDLEKVCDREFTQYIDERKEWVKAQLESERRFDTLLTTICTLALGATFLKDFVNRGGTLGVVFLVLAWLSFATCLVLTLVHQYLSYETHRRWIEVVDSKFADWNMGAMASAVLEYEKIPFIKRVEGLKMAALVAVICGLLSALCFILATIAASAASPSGAGMTQNFYMVPATQSTTQPVHP